MGKILIGLLACAPFLFAQETPRVVTIQDFMRNVGNTEQQNKQFPPHKIVGNVYYVGTESLSAFLVTTPQGHILINSIYERNVPTIQDSVQKLGFKFEDIKILLGSHAHGDHQEGDGLVVKLTGARAMAMAEDIPILQMMRSPGDVPRPMYETLHDGSEVKLGNVTLTAHHTPGHTPGCTTWTTRVQEKGRPYSIVFQACGVPNAGVKLVGNTKFPTLVEDTLRSFRIQKTLKPDIYLPMHPESYLAGKVEAIKAGKTPHPLLDPEGYAKLVADTETNFQKRVQEERTKTSPPEK